MVSCRKQPKALVSLNQFLRTKCYFPTTTTRMIMNHKPNEQSRQTLHVFRRKKHYHCFHSVIFSFNEWNRSNWLPSFAWSALVADWWSLFRCSDEKYSQSPKCKLLVHIKSIRKWRSCKSKHIFYNWELSFQ